MFEPDAVLTDNIWGYLWGKLAYGAMLFATSLNNDSMSENFADPQRFAVFDALGREVIAVARARGITPVGFKEFDPEAFAPGAGADARARRDRVARRIHQPRRQDPLGRLARPRGAQAQDRGRPADRDHRARSAREAGIATPAIDRLVALIHDVEDGRRAALVRDIPGADRHMHIRQDGRVALVTGAAQGIGQAIAIGLKECGAHGPCRRPRRGARERIRASERVHRAHARRLRPQGRRRGGERDRRARPAASTSW